MSRQSQHLCPCVRVCVLLLSIVCGCGVEEREEAERERERELQQASAIARCIAAHRPATLSDDDAADAAAELNAAYRGPRGKSGAHSKVH